MILTRKSFLRFLLVFSIVGYTSATTSEDELGQTASLFSGPVEVVASNPGFQWLESPLFSESGEYLLFSDVKWASPDTGFTCGMLWKYSMSTKEVTEFLKCAGLAGPPGPNAYDGLPLDIAVAIEAGPNGLTWGWNGDGSLLMCQHGWKRIVQFNVADVNETVASIDPNLVTVVVDTYNSTNLNSPNDLDLADDGVLYFSDPPFGHQNNDVENPFGNSFELMTQDAPAVYSLNETGGVPVRVLEYDVPDDWSKRYGPNGVAVNDANGDLAVAITDFLDPRVNIYPRNKDGTIGTELKTSLNLTFRIEGDNADTMPALVDGITFDSDLGILFVSGPGGIYIYETDGGYEYLGFIRIDDLCSNNIVGGGYLWMTCNQRLLRIPLSKSDEEKSVTTSSSSKLATTFFARTLLFVLAIPSFYALAY
eukprot:CAMPEP_0172481020 /NCGR_PEP_ID=MMETSP1066-20121228/6529_1 /TAXON_ID=671091 /ORGANISM="Coscinodiscus wailesii, Strain CCMP2513" /LENGTH=421 /DNA_ID=CAMNT_0013242897 /DNA_START=81 /DNA_END=1346 /DNA_ORIENTATION=+